MKKRKKLQYTKLLVSSIIAVSIIDLQFILLLSLLDKTVPESLAVAIVTEILGVVVAYSLKSFKETKEEKANEILTKQLNITTDTVEDAVG